MKVFTVIQIFMSFLLLVITNAKALPKTKSKRDINDCITSVGKDTKISNATALPKRDVNNNDYIVLVGKDTTKISKVFPINPLPSHLFVFRKWNLTKYINVFGVHIIAIDAVPNIKMEHAANVMAQYLDNDEDGIPDNMMVLKSMLDRKSTLVMFNNSHDKIVEEFFNAAHDGFQCQDLEANETAPEGKFDTALEEVFHLISANGFSIVYPGIFGISGTTPVTSVLARHMIQMIGNCGYAFNGTRKWPHCTGYYHYYNKACKFTGLQVEYFYWMLTSILGAQDGPLAPKGRCTKIANDWELCNKELVSKYNPKGYALITDQKYRLPTKLPNGRYSFIKY